MDCQNKLFTASPQKFQIKLFFHHVIGSLIGSKEDDEDEMRNRKNQPSDDTWVQKNYTVKNSFLSPLSSPSSLSTTEKRHDCLRRVRVRAAAGGPLSPLAFPLPFAGCRISVLSPICLWICGWVTLPWEDAREFFQIWGPLCFWWFHGEATRRFSWQLDFVGVDRFYLFDLSRMSPSWWLVSGRRAFESPYGTGLWFLRRRHGPAPSSRSQVNSGASSDRRWALGLMHAVGDGVSLQFGMCQVGRLWPLVNDMLGRFISEPFYTAFVIALPCFWLMSIAWFVSYVQRSTLLHSHRTRVLSLWLLPLVLKGNKRQGGARLVIPASVSPFGLIHFP
ncbi:hypothetical protein YC2023_039088 [Brassica napus]